MTETVNYSISGNLEAIDRGKMDCADECRQRLASLYERLFPTLAEQGGRHLLTLALKLNAREIATPGVLAGIVLGNAFSGQFEAGRRVLNKLKDLEPSRLKQVTGILESFADDSMGGRALRSMRERSKRSEV